MKKRFEEEWKAFIDSCDPSYGEGDPYFLAERFFEAGIKEQQKVMEKKCL